MGRSFIIETWACERWACAWEGKREERDAFTIRARISTAPTGLRTNKKSDAAYHGDATQDDFPQPSPSPSFVKLQPFSTASDDFTRSSSEPAPPRSRCFSTVLQLPRRESMAVPPSLSSPSWEEEARHTPSLLALALTNFHPSFPSHALSSQTPALSSQTLNPNPSSSRRTRRFAAKRFPSLRTAPSCAPPVDLLSPLRAAPSNVTRASSAQTSPGGRRTKHLRITTYCHE
ncbi:hypothetical protein T484DRAFT_1849276 [Baffinella frigidus]|nr:hypothetical protein T484DRAFT_1849276 [Cryptophyta sp. CCMP2293]